MKLLVCDIEGTIFQPHMIKSAQHASYIWTAIAEALGPDAEREEINTQRKWRSGGYGAFDSGASYLKWVNASICIHAKYHLRRSTFQTLIDNAPYVQGVREFFARLDRTRYIPIFISGGIQDLNHRACRDLNVSYDDSYASCQYFFDHKDELNTTLTFSNTCNFFGKHELINVALRKYGLGPNDWIFIGDGINDVSVAKAAPLSIGISPIEALRQAVDYSFRDFNELLQCEELLERSHLISDEAVPTARPADYRERAALQVGKLNLKNLERRAYRRYQREFGEVNLDYAKRAFFGIEELLQVGEQTLELLEKNGQSETASAVLQPFCSASEIMINIAAAITGAPEILEEIVSPKNNMQNIIEQVDNSNLKQVLHAYRENRNAIAHTYQPVSLEAAHSMARRTYENIQRLELLINAPE